MVSRARDGPTPRGGAPGGKKALGEVCTGSRGRWDASGAEEGLASSGVGTARRVVPSAERRADRMAAGSLTTAGSANAMEALTSSALESADSASAFCCACDPSRSRGRAALIIITTAPTISDRPEYIS